MIITPQAQDEATKRIIASQSERQNTREYLNKGDLLGANSSERIEKRKVRMLANQSLGPALGSTNRNALAGQLVREAPREAQLAFERTIGGKDTQPCWFLTRGTEIRRTVGRIHIRDATKRIGWGTGFLVAPNLLVTNQHVLDSIQTARYSRVEFDYEETFSGELLPSAIFQLEPDVFFISSPAKGGKDYALVAVSSRAHPDSKRPMADLAEFGYNTIVREEGKLMKGELIYCIHHPEGQSRQVNLRENRLTALDEPELQGTWMHYETDTEPGSSGAPLYNSSWEVVGIHHAGVEKRDAAGNILAIGGGQWSREMGERQKAWEANEGLRISKFIADTEAQVKAALNPAIPSSVERRVSDKGYALFESILKSTQNGQPPTFAPPVTVMGSNPIKPPLPRRPFNPD